MTVDNVIESMLLDPNQYIFEGQRKRRQGMALGNWPHLSGHCHSNCQDSRWPVFLPATTTLLTLTQLLLLPLKLLQSALPVLIHLCDLIFAVRTGISVNLMRLFPAFYFHYLETVCIKSGLNLLSTPQRAIPAFC